MARLRMDHQIHFSKDVAGETKVYDRSPTAEETTDVLVTGYSSTFIIPKATDNPDPTPDTPGEVVITLADIGFTAGAKFLYLESEASITITLDTGDPLTISPVASIVTNVNLPGRFMITSNSAVAAVITLKNWSITATATVVVTIGS